MGEFRGNGFRGGTHLVGQNRDCPLLGCPRQRRPVLLGTWVRLRSLILVGDRPVAPTRTHRTCRTLECTFGGRCVPLPRGRHRQHRRRSAIAIGRGRFETCPYADFIALPDRFALDATADRRSRATTYRAETEISPGPRASNEWDRFLDAPACCTRSRLGRLDNSTPGDGSNVDAINLIHLPGVTRASPRRG